MNQAKRTDRGDRNRRTVLIAAIAALVIGGGAALWIYGNTRAPFRATVLEVDDTSISMAYFLKRLSLASTSASSMLQTLTAEQLIKQVAPQPPYNIRILEEDVDQALEDAAGSRGTEDEEHLFGTWYQGQLEQTGLSDSEYRDLVRTELLTRQLIKYLVERVPTVAEQARLSMISQSSLEAARAVKNRLDAGKDFVTVARELNLGSEVPDGDLGWFPRTGLSEDLAEMVFDELETGVPSEPLVLGEQLFAIILVTERAPARQIDEEILQNLRSNVLEEWLVHEIPHHRIVLHGLNNGFDAETEAWVRWQLQRMNDK